MSGRKGVYLLRLRHEYLYDGDCSGSDHDGWRNPRNAPYEHAFASYGAAAAWVAKYPPIHANPFDHAGFYAGHSRWAFDYIANESR